MLRIPLNSYLAHAFCCASVLRGAMSQVTEPYEVIKAAKHSHVSSHFHNAETTIVAIANATM
jgi:hypothetical protein